MEACLLSKRQGSRAIARLLQPLGIGVAHRPEATIKRLIMRPKDPMSRGETENVVYRVQCSSCEANYVEEAGKQLQTRMRALTFNLTVNAPVIYPNYLTSDRRRLIMSTDSTSQPIAGIHTFDLPTVWLGDIALWLRSVESRFALRQITREDTKFHYVVAALPMDIATDLRES
ncbi:hypothetical protein SprV_0401712100 [Sparganum proliferum]